MMEVTCASDRRSTAGDDPRKERRPRGVVPHTSQAQAHRGTLESMNDGARTAGDRPPRTMGEDTDLRRLIPADAEALFAAVDRDREHLDRWLRWSGSIRSENDARSFLDGFTGPADDGGFHEGIWLRGRLAGGVVCWYEDRRNRSAEVGYWLGREFTGRGLATRATRLVVEHLFAERSLHRVEMQCGIDNAPSRRVPERLGFRLEGIRRDSHWISNRFVDHCVYGCLVAEWNTDPGADR